MAVTVCPTYDTLQPAMVPLSAAVGDRPVGSVSLTVAMPGHRAGTRNIRDGDRVRVRRVPLFEIAAVALAHR